MYSLVESDDEQVSQVLAEVERHLLTSPIEHPLQRYDCKEAYYDASGGIQIRPVRVHSRTNVASLFQWTQWDTHARGITMKRMFSPASPPACG